MFQRTIICLFLLLLSFASTKAQNLTISYEQTALEEGKSVTNIYMQVGEEDSTIIRAVNFSFLMDKSCASFVERQSVFTENWSRFLERQVPMDSLERDAGKYNHRLLYGIAEPQGMPGTRSLKIPGTKDKPMLVLSMTWKGSCANDIRMEDEAENAINQIGDTNLRPIPYQLEHPGDE